MKNTAGIAISRVSAVALILTTACATSPLGRRQLNLIPAPLMTSLGAQSFQQLKEQQKVERDPALNAYVRCVTNPVLDAARQIHGAKMPADWEIVVFKDSTANAFALPGGKIGVHTGLLAVATSDAQLAAVMGHEIGHVIAEHGNERVSQGMLAQGFMIGADLALFRGKSDAETEKKRTIVMAGLGLGAQLGVLLPYSRTHESEADLMGLTLMAWAGFPPEESVALWNNMQAQQGQGPPEFLSSHPSNQMRVRHLEQAIPRARNDYEAAKASGKNPICRRP